MIESSELLKMCIQKEMNRSACPFPGQQVTQEKKRWQSLTIQGAMEEMQRLGSSSHVREEKSGVQSVAIDDVQRERGRET